MDGKPLARRHVLQESRRGVELNAWYSTVRVPTFEGAESPKRMLLREGRIDAEGALRAGLVSDIVPQKELLERANTIAVRAIEESDMRDPELTFAEDPAIEVEKSCVMNLSQDAKQEWF